MKRWQNIQDILSGIINISIRTVDENGRIVVQPANMPEICAQVIASSSKATKRCWQWFPHLVNHLKNRPTPSYTENVCPNGLVNLALSVSFDNNSKPIYLIIGPVILENGRRDVQLSSRLKEMEVDEDKFFTCFNKLPVIKTSQLSPTVEFLKSTVQYLGKLNAFQLISNNKEARENQERIVALLKIFLEAAMKLSQAEFGSIMIFEKNTQQLFIKDAKGLSKDVIDQTKLKIGEGIAGLTVKRRHSLFVNEQLKDREIRLRMHRPAVKSAFVIPVFYKDDILGVISVATAKQPNNFSDKLMELLNELIGVALEKIAIE